LNQYCRVRNCSESDIITYDTRFLFVHLCKHLRTDLNDTAKELGIPNPYFENKYSLINAIIRKWKEMEN